MLKLQNLFFINNRFFSWNIIWHVCVGGGFLTTPILIVSGIPPAVAVGSEANHIVGSSLTGFLTYFRRKYVDIRMGSIMISGGASSLNFRSVPI